MQFLQEVPVNARVDGKFTILKPRCLRLLSEQFTSIKGEKNRLANSYPFLCAVFVITLRWIYSISLYIDINCHHLSFFYLENASVYCHFCCKCDW